MHATKRRIADATAARARNKRLLTAKVSEIRRETRRRLAAMRYEDGRRARRVMRDVRNSVKAARLMRRQLYAKLRRARSDPVAAELERRLYQNIMTAAISRLAAASRNATAAMDAAWRSEQATASRAQTLREAAELARAAQ